jgi:hypothetical protein
MDIQSMYREIIRALGAYVPNIIGALAILVIGWLVALGASAAVRSLLKRTSIDNKIAGKIFGDKAAESMNVERGCGKVVFYTIMLFVLVMFFDALKFNVVTEPINNLLNNLFAFIPQIIGAGVLLLVAWVLASVIRFAMVKILQSVKLDEHLGTPEGGRPFAKTLGDALYWLIFLLFLPAILSALELSGLLQPVQAMLDKLLSFLPNLLAATIIMLVGWFIARLVQRIVTNLLSVAGLDKLSERFGVKSFLGEQKLSGATGWIVYLFIIIPTAIAALNALALDAITRPASDMLNLILRAIPNIFAAALVLAISFAIGRLVAPLITNVLTKVGFNKILPKLGIGKEPAEGQRTPAQIVGTIFLAAIMFFAAMEAAGLLGFEMLGTLISGFLVFAGQVLLGLVIIAIGMYVANLAAALIRSSGVAQSGLLALVARVAILLLAGAMGLSRMGLADNIIQLAFGLILGSVMIAAAIAFGIGGRDFAARQLETWSRNFQKDK